MTIVASNSLTISNVNDGTITHTAWSYSADGTDRFTTVYPNLNLGDNTKTFVGTEVEASNLRGSIRIDPVTQKTQDGDFYYLTAKAPRNGYDWFRFYLRPNSTTPNMTKVAVKPNTKYTFSVLLKGTGQHTIYAYQNWTAPNTPWSLQINLTSDWKLYTFTVTSKDVIPSEDVQFFIRSNNATEISLKYPKVEEGSTATPWTPSQSEDQAQWQDAIPMYIGVGEKDSQKPSDYRWVLNPRYVQASSDNGLSSKAGLDDLASVADTANDALVQAQNAVSNENYTSWLEHDYQNTIEHLRAVSAQNQKDTNKVDDRTTIVEGFYDEMKVKWNFIDESFTFSKEGMFISN